MTPSAAVKLQKEIAGKVIARDDFSSGRIELVCGVDVSYRQGVAHCSAVVVDLSFSVMEQASTKNAITQPYIPGLFMLRGAGPVLRMLKLIKRYDLLLVDGHGQLDPRRCDLACFVGATLDRAAIGVAKSLLCGRVKGENIELGGQVLGRLVNNRLYVSVGRRTSLGNAADIVKKLVARAIRGGRQNVKK